MEINIKLTSSLKNDDACFLKYIYCNSKRLYVITNYEKKIDFV